MEEKSAINTREKGKTNKEFQKYKTQNSLKIDLKNKLDNIQRDINIDEMYGNYVDTITSTLDEHAPISRWRCTNKQYKSWFDGKALKLKIQRRKSERI